METGVATPENLRLEARPTATVPDMNALWTIAGATRTSLKSNRTHREPYGAAAVSHRWRCGARLGWQGNQAKARRRPTKHDIRLAAGGRDGESAQAETSGNGSGSPTTREEEASETYRAEVLPQEPRMTPGNQGYRSVVVAGCEFLIGLTPEGMLDLREIFVYDGDTGIYGRPQFVGEQPAGPAFYNEVRWEDIEAGDPVTYKKKKVELIKLYLIEEKSKDPYELNLREVYCLDGKLQQVQHHEVGGAEAANPQDTRLVIREDGIFLDDIKKLPTPTDIFNEFKRAEWEGKGPLGGKDGLQTDEEVDDDLAFEESDVPEVDML